jgi:hypothetical protein
VTSGVAVRSYTWYYDGPGPSYAKSFTYPYVGRVAGHNIFLSVLFANGQTLTPFAVTPTCP